MDGWRVYFNHSFSSGLWEDRRMKACGLQGSLYLCGLWRSFCDEKFRRFMVMGEIFLRKDQLCEYDTLSMLIISIQCVQIVFSLSFYLFVFLRSVYWHLSREGPKLLHKRNTVHGNSNFPNDSKTLRLFFD